jgi:hypothetical protein
MYWIYDLVRLAGGRYLHLETEDKDTPALRLSLTGYDAGAGVKYACESMDDFQKKVKSGFEDVAKFAEKNNIGRRVPFVIGIDSLTAKMTEDAYAVVNKNYGAPERRWADEARSLSDWFKVVTRYLKGWPFYLVTISHDKPSKDAKTQQVKHKTPGGLAPRYYATYQLLLHNIGRLKTNAKGWEGNIIKFLADKNSLGSDRRSIEARIEWRRVTSQNAKGDKVDVQETVWGWHRATTDLLMTMTERKPKDRGPMERAVIELLGLSKKGGRISSSTLGIHGDQALDPVEMGHLIESTPDLLALLEPELGIHTSAVFDPEVDLLEQLKEARANSTSFIPATYNVTEGASKREDGDVEDYAEPAADSEE